MRTFGRSKVFCPSCEAKREARKEKAHRAFVRAKQATLVPETTGHHRCELCGKTKTPGDATCELCRRSEVQ
jgi:hypothetical protein